MESTLKMEIRELTPEARSAFAVGIEMLIQHVPVEFVSACAQPL